MRPGYGAPGRYPVPATPPTSPGPRRARRTASSHRGPRAAIAVGAVTALAATGGLTYYLLSGRATGRTSATSTVHTPAPARSSNSTTPAAAHAGDLRRYLIAAPAGSHPWPQPLGTDGKLSLAQAASLSSNRTARRKRLIEDHYLQGAVKSWVTEAGTWIDVRLYRFGSAADARSLYLTDIDGSSSSTPVADQSAVTDVPGARAFADPKPDSSGFISVIAVGVKGDVVFIVDAAEHSKRASLGTPDMLMREQYGKL